MDSCLVCESRALERRFEIRARSSHLGVAHGPYTLYRCTRCGFERIAPLPDPELLGRIYSSSFFGTAQQHVPIDAGGDFAPDAKRWPIYRNAEARVEALCRLKPRGSLLDIGCGKGVFLKVASRHFRALGVDLSEEAAEAARALGLEVRSGDFETMDLLPERFDVVTLWDALASMLDPVRVLGRVERVLAPGGVAVLTVPDAGSRMSRLLGPRWPLMIPPINLSFFTEAAFARLAARTGLFLRAYRHDLKWVDAGFLALKLARTLGLGTPGGSARRTINIPLNLGDIATVILEKHGS